MLGALMPKTPRGQNSGISMNIAQIEKNVKQVLRSLDEQTFIFDLLLAYGIPKPSVSRLMSLGASSYNLSTQPSPWGGVHLGRLSR